MAFLSRKVRLRQEKEKKRVVLKYFLTILCLILSKLDRHLVSLCEKKYLKAFLVYKKYITLSRNCVLNNAISSIFHAKWCHLGSAIRHKFQ